MKRSYKVRTLVDEDVQKKYSIRFPSQIEFYVITYLNDPNGWGPLFEPVSINEDVLIRLTTPEIGRAHV